MTLTPIQTLGIILAVAAGTQLTRWLPFWLFPEKRDPRRWWPTWAGCCRRP